MEFTVNLFAEQSQFHLFLTSISYFYYSNWLESEDMNPKAHNNQDIFSAPIEIQMIVPLNYLLIQTVGNWVSDIFKTSLPWEFVLSIVLGHRLPKKCFAFLVTTRQPWFI